MDPEQDAGTGGEADDISYADRGTDNTADLTRADENTMDRVAQAGTTGAFGAGSETDSEQRREDAAAAFGGDVESGGGQQGGAGGGAMSDAGGSGVSLGDVAGGSSDPAGKRADDELAGGPGTGGGAGTSSAGIGGV